MVMNVKQNVVPNWSDLANSNEGNIVTNTGYNGGRGHGRGGNRSGGGRGRGSPGGGCGGGHGTDRDKLHCTHCWDLNGLPHNVSATSAEEEHPNENTEQET